MLTQPRGSALSNSRQVTRRASRFPPRARHPELAGQSRTWRTQATLQDLIDATDLDPTYASKLRSAGFSSVHLVAAAPLGYLQTACNMPHGEVLALHLAAKELETSDREPKVVNIVDGSRGTYVKTLRTQEDLDKLLFSVRAPGLISLTSGSKEAISDFHGLLHGDHYQVAGRSGVEERVVLFEAREANLDQAEEQSVAHCLAQEARAHNPSLDVRVFWSYKFYIGDRIVEVDVLVVGAVIFIAEVKRTLLRQKHLDQIIDARSKISDGLERHDPAVDAFQGKDLVWLLYTAGYPEDEKTAQKLKRRANDHGIGLRFLSCHHSAHARDPFLRELRSSTP